MKIAIPSSGTDLSAPVDARFGRAQNFLIHDIDSKETALVENRQNLNAPQGAGIQSAQAIVQAGAQVLLAGNCGPKAFAVLKQAGIKVFLVESGSVKDAISAYMAGTLKEANSANVEGHW